MMILAGTPNLVIISSSKKSMTAETGFLLGGYHLYPLGEIINGIKNPRITIA